MSSYDRSALVYDAIYEQMKDYRHEAEVLRGIIEANQDDRSYNLLDVACGTGLHDQYLNKYYAVVGVDLSAEQLAVARRRLPLQTLIKADMTTFNLRNKQFDVVTCLFSAIGHLLTLDQLNLGIANMAAHVRPGGLLIVEPWIHPHQFVDGRIGCNQVERPGLSVQRMVKVWRQGNLTHMDLHHTIGRPGQNIEHFVETMTTAMYTIREYTQAFRLAGLEVWHDSQGLMGRGLFIGRKPR